MNEKLKDIKFCVDRIKQFTKDKKQQIDYLNMIISTAEKIKKELN